MGGGGGQGGGRVGRLRKQAQRKDSIDFRPFKVQNSVYMDTYVHHVSSACLNKYCGRISSVGRALSCRVGGHRFDSNTQTKNKIKINTA